MKTLLATLLFCLIPTVLFAAATERGFTIEYTEPTTSMCGPSTQLKPVSSPVMCIEGLGSEVQQNTCDAAKNQRFEMIPQAQAGLFQLQSVMTLECLKVGNTNGDPVIETTCGIGDQNQVFRIGPSPSAIQSNSGAGGLCLDVQGNSTADGAKIQSFQCHGGTNQSFNYSLSPGNDCPLDDLAGTRIYADIAANDVVPSGTVPQLVSPAPGSMYQETMTFTWVSNGETAITEYWLYVGTGVSGDDRKDIYDSRGINVSETSHTATGLPTDGRLIHVIFFWKIGADWLEQRVTYGIAGIPMEVPASAKTGGGKITQPLCIPILDDATATHINLEVTAFDESGNESPKTPTLVYQVPGTRDCLPPDVTAPAIPVGVGIIP